jgi:sigma-E factor negative regulatory protein RseA
VAAERLSALMDGELRDAGEVAQGCRAWRDEAALRESWHRYHLIGDVMRSEDLAVAGLHDAAFLRGLRARLEAEPVVLAPSARPAPARAVRWRWAGPAAVAAGFVAVAGVLVATRVQAPEPAPAIAAAPAAVPAPAAPAVTAVATAPAAEPAAPPVNGKLIRDARLDRYLAAHQQFAGTSALGPSTFLRRATTDAANR